MKMSLGISLNHFMKRPYEESIYFKRMEMISYMKIQINRDIEI